MTQARVSGTDGLGPPGFTVRNMENMVFSDRQYAGELTRDRLSYDIQSLEDVASRADALETAYDPNDVTGTASLTLRVSSMS